ncbi:MAG: cytochrome C [Bacteroidetes bacterium]|nr:cytochrome C [Bacteroidota bacterium]
MRKAMTILALLFVAGLGSARAQNDCIDCHRLKTPGIVSDWELSKHSKSGVTCNVCHGTGHNGLQDIDKVRIPTPAVCGECHAQQVAQFTKGKHADAWASSNAMPTAHFQPMALMSGMKGCNGCHKIGLKTEADIKQLKAEGQGYGLASCDACHTRHAFSKKEAQQPQACQTCHTGSDHPQWEMYSGSKHGVRALLRQNGTLHESIAGPTCQDCHMSKGNHEVRTAWGFFGVRLPMPEDAQWAADRTTILQALGVLDPDAQPTERMEVVSEVNIMRMTNDAWQIERDKMSRACAKCHSSKFADGELAKGDDMIRESDHVMANAILEVASLYKDGLIPRPGNYRYPFPDLLTFHNAPTAIETRLYKMFFKHRMRTFMGTFHMNPDYALWNGWSEMVEDYTAIKSMAEEYRLRAKK